MPLWAYTQRARSFSAAYSTLFCSPSLLTSRSSLPASSLSHPPPSLPRHDHLAGDAGHVPHHQVGAHHVRDLPVPLHGILRDKPGVREGSGEGACLQTDDPSIFREREKINCVVTRTVLSSRLVSRHSPALFFFNTNTCGILYSCLQACDVAPVEVRQARACKRTPSYPKCVCPPHPTPPPTPHPTL